MGSIIPTPFKSTLPVILGALEWGCFDHIDGLVDPFPTVESVAPMIDLFQSHGHNKLDTNRLYGLGRSEKLIGESDWETRGLTIETKLYPTKYRFLGELKKPYNHGPDDLREGLMDSLELLKAKKIDTWFLSAPDRSTPFEVTMKTVNDLYNEGYFVRFGLSNFKAWEVAQLQEICIKHGWVRPTVFQGIYNALLRDIEPELVHCIRHYGMSLEAAQPLASGMLAYRLTPDQVHPIGSRFDPNPDNIIGRHLRVRYLHQPYFDAMEIIHKAAKKHGFTEQECAMRWLTHHSVLDKDLGDAICVGGGTLEHLEENLTDLEKGPLPQDVVDAFEEAWTVASAHRYAYWH
ncbi:aldo/keto reductase [Phlyctema vagabunda]|uniref:Aldo/keto reductase n=1 Tax=Phlyctema vagabunda TaxID=108571 RepID=A0ABR4PUY0_9HELO